MTQVEQNLPWLTGQAWGFVFLFWYARSQNMEIMRGVYSSREVYSNGPEMEGLRGNRAYNATHAPNCRSHCLNLSGRSRLRIAG
jgi:hypothetical protein